VAPEFGVAVIIYGVWVGASVGVRLAVGVRLGGIDVEVGVATGLNCSLQAERVNRKQNVENTIRIIGCGR